MDTRMIFASAFSAILIFIVRKSRAACIKVLNGWAPPSIRWCDEGPRGQIFWPSTSYLPLGLGVQRVLEQLCKHPNRALRKSAYAPFCCSSCSTFSLSSLNCVIT